MSGSSERCLSLRRFLLPLLPCLLFCIITSTTDATPTRSVRTLRTKSAVSLPHKLAHTFSRCPTQRTYSGYCTHPFMKNWGMAGRPLSGFYNRYHKVRSQFRGPSPRRISNIVFTQHDDKRSHLKVSEFANCFSQFIDHVFTHVLVDKKDRWDIPVPFDDETFGKNEHTRRGLKFTRSKRLEHPVMRNLIPNDLSSYVDASNVYGHNEERAKMLRSGKDGLLKIDEERGCKNGDVLCEYPPRNSVKTKNSPSPNMSRLFLAGDVRANEQPNLLVIHTIWLREHNLIARDLKKEFPHWNDEQLYQGARTIVIAEMQKVTYDEMIPAFLGGYKDSVLGRYSGWKWWVRPELSNFFTTSSFRLGHSMVNDNLTIYDENDSMKHLDMRHHFWNPKAVEEMNLDPFLKGMARTVTQETDTEMQRSLRNFLFNGVPQAIGFDLAAINIQRGRDHGLLDYNSLRRKHGLRPKISFEEITKDKKVARALREAYNGDIDSVDSWVGGLAEDHVPGACMGELFRESWIKEFRSLRDGDRLWYQQYDVVFSKDLQRSSKYVKDIMRDKLAMKDIIVRTSGVSADDIQDNVFVVS